MDLPAIVVVLCTIQSDRANTLADLLLTERLCACVQVLGPIHSRYWWDGRIEQGDEMLLLIKTRKDLLPELNATIVSNHGYQVPEILALDVASGLPAYLEWVTTTCRPSLNNGQPTQVP